MNIEHLAMYVLDLENTKDFFVRYFGAKSNELYHNRELISNLTSCRLTVVQN